MKNGIGAEQVVIAASQSLKAKQYWLNELSGELQKTTFPYDLNKPGKNEPGLNKAKFSFTGDLFLRLMKLSNDSDARLHMILTAGLVALLNKYTGSKDIILGAPIYKQDIEADFINTVLVLRNQLDDNMVFKDLLLQVRETIFAAVENQNYPFESLLNELNLASSPHDFALFDVVILVENIHDKSFIQHVKTSMTFAFSRTEQKVDAALEYHSLRYEKMTVERIITHFTRLLRKAVFNLDLKITDLDILSPEEKNQLLYDFNHTAALYPKEKTIHELFETVADEIPNSTAIIDQDKHITYKELNERANQLARIITAKGIKPDTTAAIMVDRSPGMMVGILGILKAGAAYLPIDTDSAENRIKFMLEDSGVKLLLTKKEFVDKAEFKRELMILDDLRIYHGNKTNLEKIAQPGNLAYMIYTSGTTGKPKGVLIEHQGLVNYICRAARTYVKHERLNFPLYTSISFDLTVTSLFTPLTTGNSVVIYGGEEKQLLIEKIIDDGKVGVVKLTPSHLKLIRYKKITHNNIKRLIVGGEELEVQLARDITKNFNNNIEIFNEYGPTETVVGSMIYKFDIKKDNRTSVPIGVPIDNTKIYVLDRNQKPTPIGCIGEIYISGDGLARGYFKDKTLTAEKFIANPFVPGQRMYRTGDTGRFLEDMNIEFLGRIDQQVKIRGFRVELAEVEAQLLNHDKIKQALVTAKEDKNRDKYLCAYFVSDDEIPVPELREYLSGYLPNYMIPSYLMQIDNIPITANGKVNRSVLPAPEFKPGREYVAPGNPVEKKFVRLWSDILEIEKDIISIDDHFFELGGHSLNATILAANIHKEFNVKMSLADIFKKPTVRGLAQYVKDLEEDQYESIRPAIKKEYYALSFAQKRLYILQQMDLENTAYNMSQVFSIEGEYKKEELEQICRKLINRHDSLRTSFEIIEGEPVQKVHDQVEFEIEYYDFQVTGAGSRLQVKEEPFGQDLNASGEIIQAGAGSHHSSKNRIIHHFFIRPFDLSQAPLLRVGWINVNAFKHIMMIDMHHIITDALSYVILAKDFMSLHRGEELPPLTLQYKDYSEWQHSEKQREAIRQQEKFWLRQMQGNLVVLNLPTDFNRPPRRSFEGSSIGFAISKEDTYWIKDLALKEDATLFMILLTIFNVLLSKKCRQEDIRIGTTAGGRRHKDLEHIIGMFVNTLVLRNYPQGEKTFKDFLKEVKERTLASLENQDYAFENLVEKVVPKRDLSRNPLFDVLFEIRRYIESEEEKHEKVESDLRLIPYELENKTTKFDMDWVGVETGEEIRFTVAYCTKLFEKESVELMADEFLALVKNIKNNVDVKIKDLDYTLFRDNQLNIYEDIEFKF